MNKAEKQMKIKVKIKINIRKNGFLIKKTKKWMGKSNQIDINIEIIDCLPNHRKIIKPNNDHLKVVIFSGFVLSQRYLY